MRRWDRSCKRNCSTYTETADYIFRALKKYHQSMELPFALYQVFEAPDCHYEYCARRMTQYIRT